MSAEEKANDLIIQFKLYASSMNRYDLSSGAALIRNAKQCAAICVREIIDAYENCSAKDSVHYYQEVLKIIEQ